MAEHHTGPVETGAPMDYKEHEQTYNMFIAGTKYGTMLLVALLLAMTAGFFGGAGLLGGLFVFIILLAAGIFLLR
ncbi:cytochrome-c oxidase [Rhizobium sp. R635]|uniref:aa3-type cytochrome c oxidase subunit IV n=1 Tax=Rhizobium sp. R635 TaxID=1764275 RepID=UPI000B53300E|nr:aa3-type cytochrome c oxidase subunit IV [Rhizobium sp. R635]OWV89541.1 cytochrome-c oxidase [Rhizobium sp. R635]